VAGSTDRRNTFCELLSWGLIEQGFSRPFIELPCDRAELGLAIQGQIDATRKILAQQSVGSSAHIRRSHPTGYATYWQYTTALVGSVLAAMNPVITNAVRAVESFMMSTLVQDYCPTA
jgi:hypothetical protein